MNLNRFPKENTIIVNCQLSIVNFLNLQSRKNGVHVRFPAVVRTHKTALPKVQVL